MTEPTAHIETTMIGHLMGRILADPLVAGRQLVSREWWKYATYKYRLFGSQLVIDEYSAAYPDAAAERLAVLDALLFVAASPDAYALTKELMRAGAIPASEPRDALHISLATVNGLEYLVSWNFKHIANATTREKIEQVCRGAGFEPPIICTPDELSEV